MAAHVGVEQGDLVGTYGDGLYGLAMKGNGVLLHTDAKDRPADVFHRTTTGAPRRSTAVISASALHCARKCTSRTGR
jgi:hypothetical protein